MRCTRTVQMGVPDVDQLVMVVVVVVVVVVLQAAPAEVTMNASMHL